jgi:methionyl-tRNA formyltransferase
MALDKKKIIFFGSSSFAVPPLKALLEMGFSPLVITKPDKPAGRGKKIRATPVKQWALECGLDVWEPTTLNSEVFYEALFKRSPDLIVSAAYGAYIPPNILQLPPFGSINLHPSLLPKYRGAAPVQRALMAGEEETGVTLAYMVEKWDAGDILLQKACQILPEDNAGTLLEKLAYEGSLLLKEALPLIFERKIQAFPQDEKQASYAPKLKEEEAWLNWERPAQELVNQVRALAPEPGASTRYRGGRLKVLKALLFQATGAPGKVLALEKEGPVVACKEGAILLAVVQPENRKIMLGKDFINGYRIQKGEIFSS